MEYSKIVIENFGRIVYSTAIIIFALIIRTAVKKTLKKTFSKFKGRIKQEGYARTNTIRILLNNIISTLIIVFAVLSIFSTWGLNIAPVLTGIGIFGIALSFGSQSLVKDLISGFFIIFEDQFHVGDTIKVSGVEGQVKKITIRSTVIKDKEGNRIYIPNSKIDIVTRVSEKALKKKVQ